MKKLIRLVGCCFFWVSCGQKTYVMGSPLFAKSVLSLPGNKQFTVTADGASGDNCYIWSAELNGSGFNHNYLKHQELMDGGELHLVMDSIPNKKRGIMPEDFPYSFSR